MSDEAQLIGAATRGDARAFEKLVRLKREQVVRTAYQVTGDLEDARDVAQGVFLSVWKALGRYDPERRFDTWLYRITVNAAIDHLRRKGPRGVLQPLPDDPSGPLYESPERVERALDRADVQKAFLQLASRLGAKQRAAFVLREIQGLDTAEVARVLDVRESTVRNHILQARRTLRSALEVEYPGLVKAASVTGGRRDGEGG
jgi:RNA polymerase sigma-70 factor (ECF subfamily)